MVNTRQKIDKLDFSKMKNFCESKDIVKVMKRQPMQWEKIFVNQTSNKGLVSRICK